MKSPKSIISLLVVTFALALPAGYADAKSWSWKKRFTVGLGTFAVVLWGVKPTSRGKLEVSGSKRLQVATVGDSVIDNHYWNGVDASCTGQVLPQKFEQDGQQPGVDVTDRSAEEAQAATVRAALKKESGSRKVSVRKPYTDHRDELQIPYHGDEKNSFDQALVDVDVRDQDYVFVSLGGNDFALGGNWNPFSIMSELIAVAREYREAGNKRVIYVMPYSPTPEMVQGTPIPFFVLSSFYRVARVALWAGISWTNAFDGYIDLGDFDDTMRAADTSQGGQIPEPTPKGANELANRIHAYVRDNTVVKS